MDDPQSFRQDGSRLIWETDPERAARVARLNGRLGWSLLIIAVVLLVIWPGAWLGSLVLGVFGAAALKQAWRSAAWNSRVVIDGNAGVVTQERWQIGDEPAQTGHWSLVNVESVAVAWRCAMSVSRVNLQGSEQVNDLIVRLTGPAGGMTIERFRRSESEAARQRAELIAAVIHKPVIRQSIRTDGFLFQRASPVTTMGKAHNPDLSMYVRTLQADEVDNTDDRVVDRSHWHLLEEPADLLALPNTWFFF